MSGSPKPRVVFLNHWASRLGGAEFSLLDILAAACTRWECHLISSEPGQLHERATALGVTCHVVDATPALENVRRGNLLRSLLLSWPSLFAYGMYLVRLRRLLRTLSPALIHANVPKSHIALSLLSFTGISCEQIFHVREIFVSPSVASLMYRFLVPGVRSRTIAISAAVLKSLPGRVRAHSTIIYNGVTVPPHIDRKTSPGALRLLYLGRVVPWKGCHALLEVLGKARVRFYGTNLTLDIVGDTTYWDQTYRRSLEKQIAEMNLQSACKLHPYTDNPWSWYTRHDVFCNASRQEPFGRSIAEAHAAGMPVVSFDSGGVAEIVLHAETGYLTPPDDTDRFVDALAAFVNDPGLLVEMGRKGRERVEKLFNSAIQAPRICDFIESVLRSEEETG